MTGTEQSVIVLIRAWRDDVGIRGTVTFEGAERVVRTQAADSTEGLAAIATAALERWASSM